MTEANREYTERINRVIDYLRGNLDRQVKLKELAKVACFSEFHFHRIFSAVSGETLNDFTNRLRLEKAARLLRYSDRSVTDIALDCGFSSSATFSRAFRSGYDTSPSRFRKSGEIKKSKICKLDLDGNILGVFGTAGKQLKQFGWIHEMDCASENELYVAELLNWRVQKLILHPQKKDAAPSVSSR
ncbi:MAG TPA: helix-turn-helix domain-containing protein [Blastocatellia bacterium]